MAEEREGRGGGIVSRLSQKVGPLPVWGWGAIALVLGIVVIAWRSKSSSSGSTSGSTLSSNGVDLSSLVAQGQPMPYYGGDYYQNASDYPNNTGVINNGGTNTNVVGSRPTFTALPAYSRLPGNHPVPAAATTFLTQSAGTGQYAGLSGSYFQAINHGGNVLIPG